VGVVVDFEVKNKHKVKVLQVERGVPGEVSYRLDDLKSGRAMVSIVVLRRRYTGGGGGRWTKLMDRSIDLVFEVVVRGLLSSRKGCA
jgi:hypothetical protein